MKPNPHGLEALFRPRGIAIVGEAPNDAVRALADRLAVSAFGGTIVTGTSLTNLPPATDLIILLTQHDAQGSELQAVAQAGAKAALLLSGQSGEPQQRDALPGELRASGVRVLGPSSGGLLAVQSNLNASQFSAKQPQPGTISFVCEDAGYAACFLENARRQGLGVSKVISLGEQADVSHADVISWLSEDPGTSVIAACVERIIDGDAFMQAASSCGKPLLLLKAGRDESRLPSVARHPGLISAWDVHRVAFHQAGGVVVSHMEALVDAADALASAGPLPASNRVAVVAVGGAAALLEDACRDQGLELPQLAPDTQARVHQALPNDKFSGKVLVTDASIQAGPLQACLEVVASEPMVDGLICVSAGEMSAGLIAAAAPLAARVPVVTGLPSQDRPGPDLRVRGFPTAERAAAAYRALVDYGRVRQRPRTERRAPGVTPMSIEGSGVMDEHETKRLLDRWGITVVPGTLVVGPGRHEVTPIRKLAIHFGFPVVLKAIHKDIVDKEAAGAVVAGIPTVDVLKKVWEQMHELFPDAAWLVHPALPGEIEVIAGARRDPVFGPVVFFGTGGAMTELYHDLSARIAPLSQLDALEMIAATKAAELMRGYRGLTPCDPAEVAEVLVKLGDLMLGQPSVQELEINPLLLTEKGPVVMDALSVIQS